MFFRICLKEPELPGVVSMNSKGFEMEGKRSGGLEKEPSGSEPEKEFERYKKARRNENAKKWEKLVDFKRDLNDKTKKELFDLEEDLVKELEGSLYEREHDLEIYLALVQSEINKRRKLF